MQDEDMVDPSGAMVAQGRTTLGSQPRVDVRHLDRRDRPGAICGEPPFDIYFSTYGNTRANIVEPQLACVLHRLEHDLQEGLGCGHALLAVLRLGRADRAHTAAT